MRAPIRSLTLLALLIAPGLGCGDTRISGPNAFLQGDADDATVALSALDLSAGVLNPLFDPNTTFYTADVANNTPSISVIPTVRAGLTVLVNGVTVASGSISADIPLAVGANDIPIVVRDASGQSRSYTVTVRRSAS